ncbi:MAG TPA: CPBP family intramembrane glutamic endopeptidase, partial [Lacipirellulaceae bacterium]|nr:CPBP family intramembrane glutamic endopeptidase [Lacipirellulaceae bacterium]
IRGWLTVLTLCVQPALVEEAFCRGLAIRLLRRVIGVHSTVMISATMFSLMHVAVLLSMPYLFLVGLALGYLRIASGTIWLPIVVHFFHNLLVLMIEWS